MKTGVSTEPCAVASRPRRAAPSRANTSNPMLTGGLAYHYPLLPIFHSVAFVGALSLPEPLTLCLDVLHPRSTRSSPCANRSRWRTIGRTSRRTAMPVIDVQVHPFDRNHPGRPWASPSHGLTSATGEEMVAAMNSVGVNGAIMVSSFSAYEYDPSYALEVYNTYPDKFRV